MNSLSQQERADLVCFSMDAKSLYPNIQVGRSAYVVRDVIENSDVTIKGVDSLELARYLAVNMTDQDIKEANLEELVMTRRYSRGPKPKVTGEQMNSHWVDNEESSWVRPIRQPTDIELKKMIAYAVMVDVTVVMRSHTFQFRGRNYIQEEGGSIGSELTGEISKTRMIVLLRRLVTKCQDLHLDMKIAGAFVDDVFIAMKGVQEGLRLTPSGHTRITAATTEEDKDVSRDVLSARMVTSIVNTLEVDITMTFDSPTMNVNGKMPVLDMVVWCEREQILFSFYEKAIKSPYVTMKNSALSWLVKKASLAGEVARRLLNTSPCLVAEGEADHHLDKFCYKMMISGYNQKERDIILKEGTARYQNICKLAAEGKRPIYRRSSWKKMERAVEGKVKKRTWYGTENKTVLFVQSTPGGILKNAVNEVVKKSGLKVRVVEKGGRKLQSLLTKSDVTGSAQCGRDECVICRSGGKGPCSKEGVCYSVTCVKCLEIGRTSRMFGETGRSGRIDVESMRRHCRTGRTQTYGSTVCLYMDVKKLIIGMILSVCIPVILWGGSLVRQ